METLTSGKTDKVVNDFEDRHAHFELLPSECKEIVFNVITVYRQQVRSIMSYPRMKTELRLILIDLYIKVQPEIMALHVPTQSAIDSIIIQFLKQLEV